MTTPCPRCGTTHTTRTGHPACTGHVDKPDQDLRPCRNHPVPGADVCRYHGGSAPQVKARAAARVVEEKATAVLQRGLADAYGEHVPDIDPGDAMLRAVSWKYAEVVALRGKVAELDDDARVWGAKQTEQMAGHGDDAPVPEGMAPATKVVMAAGANIWWQMLRTAEEQLVKFAAAARAAGCDERRVRLAEQQGDLVATALGAILAAMLDVVVAAVESIFAAAPGDALDALRRAWSDAVAEVVPRELRRIESAG